MAKFVLGVDIGFANTGLVLFKLNNYSDKGRGLSISDAIVIETHKNNTKKSIRTSEDDILRINHIARQSYDFIKNNMSEKDSILIFAEAPHGGSKSSRASRAMGIATAIPAVLFEIMRLPVEYVTPQEVKVAVTGKKSASKEEIMDEVIKILNGKTETKTRKSKGEDAEVIKYYICGKEFGKNFEHIADSVGAILHGKKNSSMFRMFVGE